MKIVVCIKQVPDTAEVKLDPKTNTLIREGVPSIINHDDKAGLEAALRLREQVGGTVTVVCMGSPAYGLLRLHFHGHRLYRIMDLLLEYTEPLLQRNDLPQPIVLLCSRLVR